MSAQTSNPWKDRVIDHLVTWYIYRNEHEDDPNKALQDLLSIETSCALDPLVSEAARDLMQEGFDTALKSFVEAGTTDSGETLYRRINFEKPPRFADPGVVADPGVHGAVLPGSLEF